MVSGTALNPIVLDNNISEHSDPTHQEIPSDIVTILSDPSSPNPLSSSLTDQSLRNAADNFDDNINLGSALFHTELEKFINCYRNC